MAYNTVLQQGRFTGTGANVTLNIRSDVDWIRVYNTTALTQAAADLAYEFYWQRGMTQGTGIFWTKLGSVGNDPITVGALGAGTGFTLLDTSIQQITLGPAVITNISNATPPRVTSAGHGLQTGDIVRMANTAGALQLDGVDFRVTRVDANNFDLSWMSAVAAAAAPGATAVFRKISNEGIYQPKARIITSITRAAQAVVQMAAPHNFTVGQQVSFRIPVVTATAFGMVELNNVNANVVAISTANNTITVDVDTTGFTAFAFPLTADTPFTYAQVVPVGEDSATALALNGDFLGDAVFNNAILGMTLAGGATGPGGAAADVMYWVAGKSFSVTNL
jgi:hypothetical protein